LSRRCVTSTSVLAARNPAQAIALRDGRGVADTEALRQAVVHYRALFDELLEVNVVKQEPMPAKQLAAHA